MLALTPKQREVLNYIKQFIETHHFSPSYRELLNHFQYKSVGTIYNLLKALKDRGHLTHQKGSRRALTLQENTLHTSEIEIPLIGKLSSLNGITTFTRLETRSIPPNYIKDPLCTYLLQIDGNDFAAEGILNDDLLIVEGRESAGTEETVIAMLNESITMIGIYSLHQQLISISSRTNQQDPIHLEASCVRIQGILKGLIRRF